MHNILQYSRLSELERAVIGNRDNLVLADIEKNYQEIEVAIKNKNILVIGGAGSIGSETIKLLTFFMPAKITIVDQNENSLADFIRSLRSSIYHDFDIEILTLPLDYGGSLFMRWFNENKSSYQIILNFAALKHVRSEKDLTSSLAIMKNNVLNLDLLLRNSNKNEHERIFSVSTDKAANSSSIMGVSKRLMEHTMFSHSVESPNTKYITARFANVAFSNGSLLKSWTDRLLLGEPLPCPQDCKRYFVTLKESGAICLLSLALGNTREIYVPSLEESQNLVLLTDVLTRFLQHNNLRPKYFYEEADLREYMKKESKSENYYPVMLTKLDTSGEKKYEEFFTEVETPLIHDRITGLRRILYQYPGSKLKNLEKLCENITKMMESPGGSLDDLINYVSTIEPRFLKTYNYTNKKLDDRI